MTPIHKPVMETPNKGEPCRKRLARHEDTLNYCRTNVRFGVVEAINGNIRMLINRSRGCKNLRYLLLKAKRMAVTNTEYVAFHAIRKAAWNGTPYKFSLRA